MNLEELKYNYFQNREKMTRDQLCDMINKLWTSEDHLYKLLDELRERNDDYRTVNDDMKTLRDDMD